MERPLTRLFEDDRCLFILKPPRVLSVAAPKGRAQGKGAPVDRRLRSEGLLVFPVHRLDYETSGVLVLAKDEPARDALADLFRKRAVEKEYTALLQRAPRAPRGRLSFPIVDLGASARIGGGGKPAETRYEVLSMHGACALVRAVPVTGRHNQIRLHFAHIGCPLVGERKFARGRDAVVKHKRALLHARALTLQLPWGNALLRVEAPLARDFRNVLEKLGSSPPTVGPERSQR